MTNRDPLKAYRPSDSGIEADWAPRQQTELLQSILSTARPAGGAEQRSRPAPRRWVMPTAVAACVAASVIAMAAFMGPTHRSSNDARPVGTPQPGVSLRVTGYEIALPPGFALDGTNPQCASTSAPHAGLTRYLVTTPAGGCPLAVTSVQRALPADAVEIPSSEEARFTSWTSPATGEWFVPMTLTDGSTVYVTVDQGLVPISLDDERALMRRLSQLTHAAKITRTP